MIFGYFYKKGWIKNGGRVFKFWCRLSRQRWYHILLIPLHIIKGYYYGFSTKQIYYFCKGIIDNKIYKEQYKPEVLKKLAEAEGGLMAAVAAEIGHLL